MNSQLFHVHQEKHRRDTLTYGASIAEEAVKNAKRFPTVPAVSFLTLRFLLAASMTISAPSASAQSLNETTGGTRCIAELERHPDLPETNSSGNSFTTTQVDSLSLFSSLREQELAEVLDKNDQMYEEIWSLVQSNFLYRDRLKNWNSWRHKFDHKMKNRTEAQSAINAMIDSLNDEYTFFRDEPSTEERKLFCQKSKVVEYKMLQGHIGYVHITTLGSMFCVSETRNALIELNQAHGLIIDLRDNWGGSIDTTFDVFSLLTNSGRFVSMKGTTENADYAEEMVLTENSAITTTDGIESLSIREFNLASGKPLVVLVNESTKSAAEMLAGALRDNGRATVIGSQTYGKGIVQRVWEFPNNTSIKISSARYFLPNGGYLHRVGLTPDLIVANQASLKQKPEIKTAKKQEAIRSGAALLRQQTPSPKTYSMVMQIQIEKMAHQQPVSAAEENGFKTKDRQLNEAQLVLRRKLVSLAKL